MNVFPALALCVALAGCNVVANQDAVMAEKAKPILRSDQFQAVAGNGKMLVAVGSQGVIVSSDNGGGSWTRTVLPGPASLVGLAACPDGSWAALDYYRKVWFSDAAAGKWEAKDLGTRANLLSITCDAKGQVWLVGSGTTLMSSADRGVTWKSQNFGEDAILMSIQFIDANNGVITGEFGTFLKTTDGGTSWQPGKKIPNDFFPHASLFADSRTGWVSGLAGVILHTTDGGETWVKQPTKFGAPMYALANHNGEMFAFGANGIVLKLVGAEWIPGEMMPAPYLRSVFSLGDKGLLVAGGGGALRTVPLGGQKLASAAGKQEH